MLFSVQALHQTWAPIATTACGIVGLWGVAMYRRDATPRIFYWAVVAAVAGMLIQVVLGLVVMSETEPGEQHLFYGVLIAVTYAFAYIYRAQFRKRPAPAYGLLLLFTMGLGIRAMTTVGVNF
jgi:hypothetical protein